MNLCNNADLIVHGRYYLQLMNQLVNLIADEKCENIYVLHMSKFLWLRLKFIEDMSAE